MLRLPRGLALSPPGAGTAGARRLRCFTAMAMPLTRRAHLKRRVATAATFGEGVTGQASGGSQGQGSQGLDSGVAQALQVTSMPTLLFGVRAAGLYCAPYIWVTHLSGELIRQGPLTARSGSQTAERCTRELARLCLGSELHV